jgi:hypothetical protein
MGQLTKNDIRRAKEIQTRCNGSFTIDELTFLLNQFIPRAINDIEYCIVNPQKDKYAFFSDITIDDFYHE